MNIGTKIRNLRESRRLSQPQLAFDLEISQTTLCNIESGVTRKIDYLLMYRICKHFGFELEYFIEESNLWKEKETNSLVAVEEL